MQTHLRAETEIRRIHLKKASKKVYIALEELDFTWSLQQIRDLRYLWRQGRPLTDIAKYFKRTDEEVAVAKKMIRKEQEYMMDIEKYKNSARYVMEENKILSKTNEDLRIRMNRMEEKYGLATALLKVVLP